MKAISLWQPWAALMEAGLKTVETRSWPTRYRGQLAIHAAKRPMGHQEKTLLNRWGSLGLVDHPLHLGLFAYGKIVAVVELVDCRPTEFFDPGYKEGEFGNYAPGRWAWVTRNLKVLDEPIPYRGRQGLFEIPDSIIKP